MYNKIKACTNCGVLYLHSSTECPVCQDYKAEAIVLKIKVEDEKEV